MYCKTNPWKPVKKGTLMKISKKRGILSVYLCGCFCAVQVSHRRRVFLPATSTGTLLKLKARRKKRLLKVPTVQYSAALLAFRVVQLAFLSI